MTECLFDRSRRRRWWPFLGCRFPFPHPAISSAKRPVQTVGRSSSDDHFRGNSLNRRCLLHFAIFKLGRGCPQFSRHLTNMTASIAQFYSLFLEDCTGVFSLLCHVSLPIWALRLNSNPEIWRGPNRPHQCLPSRRALSISAKPQLHCLKSVRWSLS